MDETKKPKKNHHSCLMRCEFIYNEWNLPQQNKNIRMQEAERKILSSHELAFLNCMGLLNNYIVVSE